MAEETGWTAILECWTYAEVTPWTDCRKTVLCRSMQGTQAEQRMPITMSFPMNCSALLAKVT